MSSGYSVGTQNMSEAHFMKRKEVTGVSVKVDN